jgi:hypothetical protein
MFFSSVYSNAPYQLASSFKVKITSSLRLIRNYDMKAYGGVGI